MSAIAEAAFRHDLLSAASGETAEVRVRVEEDSVRALAHSAVSLVALLLKWVAAERDEPITEIASMLRADLLILDAIDGS